MNSPGWTTGAKKSANVIVDTVVPSLVRTRAVSFVRDRTRAGPTESTGFGGIKPLNGIPGKLASGAGSDAAPARPLNQELAPELTKGAALMAVTLVATAGPASVCKASTTAGKRALLRETSANS